MKNKQTRQTRCKRITFSYGFPPLSFFDLVKKWNKVLGWDLKIGVK